MPFSYNSDDLTGDLAQVRFWIGDTREASAGSGVGVRPDGSNYDDAELNYCIALGADWKEAVVTILTQLAGEWSLEASHREGQRSVEAGNVADNIRKQLTTFVARIPGLAAGQVGFYQTEGDGDKPPHPFSHDMFDFDITDNRTDE